MWALPLRLKRVTAAMSAAVTGYAETQLAEEAQEIFLDALKALTLEESAAWIFQLWFRPQTKLSKCPVFSRHRSKAKFGRKLNKANSDFMAKLWVK